MGLNVNLPDDVGQGNYLNQGASDTASETTNHQAPDATVSKAETSTETTRGTSLKELLDLDKLDRFRFEGKEWTPKEAREALMRREDYTRKTQEVAEARKYATNFPHDLKALKINPSLISQFEKIYPPEYVEEAKEILKLLNARTEREEQPEHTAPVSEQSAVPKEFEAYLKKALAPLQEELGGYKSALTSFQEREYQAQVAEKAAWLDKTYNALSKKYPNADEELVTARAEYIRSQGNEITEQVLDRIFRDVDGKFSEKYKSTYQNKVKDQLEANAKGKDIGAGGGIPGSPAVRPKNMKEAKEAALAHFEGRR